MNLETKLALVDAAHWIECVDRQLREMMTLADELDARLRDSDNSVLAIDASRLANKAAGTIVRNNHVRNDLSKIKQQLDPS